MTLRDWLLARAGEKSTWAGAFVVLGLALHTQLPEGLVDQAVQGLLAIAGIAAILMKENAK